MDQWPTVQEDQEIDRSLIRPQHITNLQGAFGSPEVETSALQLVDFFKQQNRWTRFYLEDLYAHYTQRGWNPNGMFFGLTGGPHIRCDGGECFSEHPKEPMVLAVDQAYFLVTRTFITKCTKHVTRTLLIS